LIKQYQPQQKEEQKFLFLTFNDTFRKLRQAVLRGVSGQVWK